MVSVVHYYALVDYSARITAFQLKFHASEITKSAKIPDFESFITLRRRELSTRPRREKIAKILNFIATIFSL